MDLVIAHKYGRLGNRLFLHAHALACAIENGVQLFNPCLDEYAQYFASFAADPLCRYPSASYGDRPARNTAGRRQRWVRTLGVLGNRIRMTRGPLQLVSAADENHELRLDDPWFTRRLRGRGYMLLDGYHFLDYFNVEKHREEIAAQFHLVDEHARNVAACVGGARRAGVKLIGIHMRRGDYRTWKQGRYYFDDDQYARLFAKLERLHAPTPVRFLIASDEPVAFEHFSSFDCVPSAGHVIEDMYCLAACDEIVGPFSTYGLWACFYGGAKVYFVGDPDKDIAADDFKTHWQTSQHTMTYGYDELIRG